MPANVSYDQAAATPYGAGTALHFLRELADLKPGEKLLVLGASGGVGRYAVQLGKHLGAEVTAVCSRSAFDLVRGLGADHLIDHRAEEFTRNGQCYDVIFDIADASSFSHSWGSLSDNGRYMSLYISMPLLAAVAWTSLRAGPKALFAIAQGEQAQTEELAGLLADGVIGPVIAERYPLDHLADAHTHADRGVHGEIVVTIGEPAAPRLVANGS